MRGRIHTSYFHRYKNRYSSPWSKVTPPWLFAEPAWAPMRTPFSKTVQPNPRFYPVLLPAHGFRPAKMPMLGMIILQPLRHGTKPPLSEAIFIPCPHCIQQWEIPAAILRFHVHFPSWRDQAEAGSYRTAFSGPSSGRACSGTPEATPHNTRNPFTAETPDNIIMTFPKVIRHITILFSIIY